MVSNGKPQTKKASTRGKMPTAFGTTSRRLRGGEALLDLPEHAVGARLDAEAQFDAAGVGHRAHHFLVDQVHPAERLPLHPEPADGRNWPQKSHHLPLARRRRTRPGTGTDRRRPGGGGAPSRRRCSWGCGCSSPGSTPGRPSRRCRDRGSRGWSSCRSRRNASGPPSRRPGRGSSRGRRSAAGRACGRSGRPSGRRAPPRGSGRRRGGARPAVRGRSAPPRRGRSRRSRGTVRAIAARPPWRPRRPGRASDPGIAARSARIASTVNGSRLAMQRQPDHGRRIARKSRNTSMSNGLVGGDALVIAEIDRQVRRLPRPASGTAAPAGRATPARLPRRSG